MTRRRSLIWQAIGGNAGGKGRGAAQVVVKITSFSSSAQKLAAHLDYISRNGDNEVFDRYGNRFSHMNEASGGGASARGDTALWQEIATASQMSYEKKGGPRKRVSMNLMLSMPAGTDKTAFELAVGEFLTREYEVFDYLYTFHDDRDHYHAHVVVGLRRQRRALAQSAQERSSAMASEFRRQLAAARYRRQSDAELQPGKGERELSARPCRAGQAWHPEGEASGADLRRSERERESGYRATSAGMDADRQAL